MTDRYCLHYAPDNASLIVRLTLEELGLPYDTCLVDRARQAHKTPDYLALNPNGLIPVLETAQGTIFETGAILLWLSDTHGALAPPPEAPDRGAFLKWLFFVSNTLHPALRMCFYADQYVGADPAAQAALLKQMRKEIARHLDKLNALAGQDAGWFADESISCLDFYVVCLLRWLALYPKGETSWFRIGDWPLLHDMAARVEYCQSAQAAIHAEGLGQNPFTNPQYATPPEGSAT